jgi:PKD repeat protein
MKKVRLLNMLTGLVLLCCASLLNSCSKDAATPAPTASFTYAANGRDVTFTSTSTNAKTYAWDFGDGTTSTDQNPKKTYGVYGKYTVKLTVVGAGGTKTSLPDELTLAKTSSVVIDASVAEWANIPEITVPAKFGTITKVKVDYDALKIYFYVEGTGSLGGFMDVYLNTDNNPATGYFSGWYPEGYGADFLVEGDFSVMKDAELFKKKTTTAVTAFDFELVGAIGANIVKSSALITVGSGKAIEFSLSRAAFTNLATKFTFAVVDVDGNYTLPNGTKTRNYTETWVTLGSSPKDNTPTGKMSEFDLTK